MRIAPSLCAAAGLAMLALPHRADACGPPMMGVHGTRPAEGETWPANAAIVLNGWPISFAGLTVTVDGQPASLVVAEELPGDAAFIEPMPAPGATVVVEGDPCASAGCDPLRLEFTAGPPDETPPPAPSSIWFDLYDHPNIEEDDGLCAPGGDLTWYIHVTAEPDPNDASPSWLVLEYQRAHGDDARWVSDLARLLGDGGEIAVALLRNADWLQGAAPPEALCFRATTIDHAGNRSEGPTACWPCRFRADDVMPPEYAMPEEPAWTADDLHPGGTCPEGMPPAPEDAAVGGGPDAGLPGGGADTERPANRGGCQVGPGAAGGGVWLLALAGLLVALRRQRPPT